MNKLIFTIGLPASGKSTWAKDYCQNEENNAVRVNMDDLRRMRGVYWVPEQEKMIVEWQQQLINSALLFGRDVVVDATNLSEANRAAIVNKTPDPQNIEVVEKVFDTDVLTCIIRDNNRSESVGADVIWKMFTKQNPNWMNEKAIESTYNYQDRISCYVFDIDGTLALMKDRGPFEWHNVGQDLLNDNVARTLLKLSETTKIILLSGRDSVCMKETMDWLRRNRLDGFDLFMRPKGDMRKDSIVKKELYYKYIAPFYDIIAVFDDRNQVVDMWRKDLGISCFQVAEGDF